MKSGWSTKVECWLSLYYDTSNHHTHSMTNPHSSPPSLVTSLYLSINHQPFPTFLEMEHPSSLLTLHSFSHFPPKDQTLFSQTFSLYFETPRLIFKLYSSLGKYNSSSLWLLHFILLKSLIAYTNSITLMLDSRKSSRHLQVFLSWTLPFSNIHLLKSHKVSSYPYIFIFSYILRGRIQVKSSRTQLHISNSLHQKSWTPFTDYFDQLKHFCFQNCTRCK